MSDDVGVTNAVACGAEERKRTASLVDFVVFIVDPVEVFLVLGRNDMIGGRNNLVTGENVTALFARAVSLLDGAGEAAFDGLVGLIGDGSDRCETLLKRLGITHLGPG